MPPKLAKHAPAYRHREGSVPEPIDLPGSDRLCVKQVQPVAGDWFYVWIEPKLQRAWIERIEAWALVDTRGGYDQVLPVLRGLPMTHMGEVDSVRHVLGTDDSPFGMTWGEIYDRTPASLNNIFRDFSELAGPVLRKHLITFGRHFEGPGSSS